MGDDPKTRSGANVARPLAFTCLMLYGLLTFLIGYEDWQVRHRLEPWVDWFLITGGVLLGAAAIRVIRRRQPAFTLSLVALLALVVVDLFADTTPGAGEKWSSPAIRTALSALILFLVKRTDRVLP